MSERPRTVCPTCGVAIEPEEVDVIEAVEIVPAPGFQAPGDTVEGHHWAFHPACFPKGDPRYRRVEE